MYLPKDSKVPSQPMFFCSKWSVGKVVDYAASLASLKNNNNVLTAKVMFAYYVLYLKRLRLNSMCRCIALLLHRLPSFSEHSKVYVSWSYKTDKVLGGLTNSCIIVSYNSMCRTINSNKGHSSHSEKWVVWRVQLSADSMLFPCNTQIIVLLVTSSCFCCFVPAFC